MTAELDIERLPFSTLTLQDSLGGSGAVRTGYATDTALALRGMRSGVISTAGFGLQNS